MTVMERVAAKLAELDAADIAIVVLRCERESDLRAMVRGYVHRAENGGRGRKRGFVCVQLDVFFVTRLLARGIRYERSELPAEKSAHITRFQNAR